jgi:hypothetical protein
VVSTYLDDWLSSSHCTDTSLLTPVCLSVCYIPLAISFASKTTKSDSSAVQLFRKDRMYPSSSSASGAVRRINKEVENDAKKEKRKKERQTGKKRRVRDSRNTGERAKDGFSSCLHPSP